MSLDHDELEEPEEGAPEWMGSFADIMSLLLGFFMILYSLSHIDECRFYELGKEIAQSFEVQDTTEVDDVPQQVKSEKRQIRAFQMLVAILNLGDPSSAVDKVEDLYSETSDSKAATEVVKAAEEEITELQNKIKKLDQADDKPLIEIILPSKILFKSGNAELTDQAIKLLSKLKVQLAHLVDLVDIEIIGHTDSQKPGKNSKYKDNWALSTARATSVVKIFIDLGLPGSMLASGGRAHFEPLVPEFTKSGKPIQENMNLNRRVQLLVRKPKDARFAQK